MDEKGQWVALCDGPLADDCRTAVFDIAAEIRKAEFRDPSLTGAGGAALLFGYLAKAFPERDFEAAIDPPLDAAIDLLTQIPMMEALYGGFTGLAWSLEHVRPSALDGSPDDDSNSGVDEVLVEALGRSPWPSEYDLISGLVGLGVYALERAPRPSAIQILLKIVDRLAELAHQRSDGLTWWSDPRFMGPAGEKYPKGTYNLGVAHGVPGLVAMLGQACAIPEVAAQARPLLDGAAAWVIARRLPVGAAGCYGYNEQEPTPARTAWCYGDPGVAAALLVAARAVGNTEWERYAIEVGLTATRRPRPESGVIDAGLCHGTVGVAHLFNRLYQATGEAAFAEAARYWYKETVEFRQPGKGVAGYLAYDMGQSGEMEWRANNDFLTGAIGVALGLLGGVTTVEPNWDRVLLSSVPPRAASPRRVAVAAPTRAGS